MTLSNAERQVRWRERHQVVLTESSEDIVGKLVAMKDQIKLRQITALLNDHFKDRPCKNCGGTGEGDRRAWASCASKKCQVTATLPCPVCRPVEYSAVSGADLRKQGRYAEALIAAFKVIDYAEAARTVQAWGATPREMRDACAELGTHFHMTDLAKMADPDWKLRLLGL
jgi:hypothetical protein